MIWSGGVIAVLESHFAETVKILQHPGIPLSADTALLALLYIFLGFSLKNFILEIIENNSKKIDVGCLILCIVLLYFALFVYDKKLYYFDMKPIYYKELVLAVIIPMLFGFVILRISRIINRCSRLHRLMCFLSICGRTTVPIMFMHPLLNYCLDRWKVGRIVYLSLGIFVPLIIAWLFRKVKILKIIFGLPEINDKLCYCEKII